jgi:hypothetical protein
MGACSPLTQILTDTIPVKMSPLVFVEVYHDQTIVKWTKVVDFDPTGRSAVINYTIQWDNYQYFDPKYYPDNTDLVNWKFAGNVAHTENTDVSNPYATYSETEITFIHENLPNFISRRKIMYRIQGINNVGENWTFDLVQSPVYGTVKIDGLLQLDETAASLHFRMNNMIV